MRGPLPLLVLGVILGLPGPGRAEPTDLAARLMRHGEAELYTLERPNDPGPIGAARVHIAAPLATVRAILSDFKGYHKVLSNLRRATMVGRSGADTDVYVEVPVPGSNAKVWALLRFSPIRKLGPDGDRLEARLLRGNVKRLDVSCVTRKIDEDNTQLDLWILLVPHESFPSAIVARAASAVAGKLVRRIRDHSEQRSRTRTAMAR